MNPRTTGLLFLAAAALGAFVWLYEIRGQEDRLAEEAAAKRLFTGIEADDVAWIALTSSDGAPVRLERSDPGWSLVEPLAFPADDFAVDAMASALAELDGGTPIEDPQPDAVYGLDEGAARVRFAAKGEEHELVVGDAAPVGSKTYVRRDAGDGVRTVPSYRVNVFDKPLDDLRRRQPLRFDAAAVDAVTVSWPGGRVVLARDGADWRMTEPLERPADAQTVATLLQDLAALRATGFVDAPPDDATTGLDAPSFEVRLSGQGGGEGEEPFDVALAIGSVPDGDGRLARAAERSLYRIAGTALDDLPTRVSAYREKQLARFDALAAGRVEVTFHTAAGQSVAVTATRGDAGWTSEPEAFAPGKVATLVGTLANLRAEDVLADAMGPDELAGLGLSPANAVYRVYARPDAEAPEAPEAEAPLLAEVSVGHLRSSDAGVAAMRAGDDAVYQLGVDRSEYIPVSYEAFENHFRAEENAAAEPAAAEPRPASPDAAAPAPE